MLMEDIRLPFPEYFKLIREMLTIWAIIISTSKGKNFHTIYVCHFYIDKINMKIIDLNLPF